MDKIEKKIEKLETTVAQIEELQEQIDLLKGSIKIDSNEASEHKNIVKLIGEYGEVMPLKSGDYAFVTNVDKKICRLEHKTWDGLIADIGTHRLTDQLRRQLDTGDISILLIDGWVTSTHAGHIKTSSKDYGHRPYWWMWNYLLSAQFAGAYILISPNEYITGKMILSIFNYLNKPEHTAMSQIQTLESSHVSLDKDEMIALAQKEPLISMEPSLNKKELMLTAIPTVGAKTAKLLYAHFSHSIQEICNADVHDLMEVDGIGKNTARVIHDFLRDLI